MLNEKGIDVIVSKVYKMIITVITGVLIQMRFRWLKGIYDNSFSTILRYLFKPMFLMRYMIDLFRPTLPLYHIGFLPHFINRIFFSEQPVLVEPIDLCKDLSECSIKGQCNHIHSRVIVYVNGSYTNYEIFTDSLTLISEMFTVPCFGFYNPTSGLYVDTFMDIVQRFTTTPGCKARELLNSMIYLTNTYKKVDEIVILSHGSGGIISEQFLRLMRDLKYPTKFINKFKFVLVGSPVCNMRWTRDEKGRLVGYTGKQLHERVDMFGNRRPYVGYYKCKFYTNTCCDEDHSEDVPYPYIESVYNTNDLVSSLGIGNKSVLCQDMIDIDGCKIEIPDKYGHYNYHIMNDSNYALYRRSYLARDYNTRYSRDCTVKTL